MSDWILQPAPFPGTLAFWKLGDVFSLIVSAYVAGQYRVQLWLGDYADPHACTCVSPEC